MAFGIALSFFFILLLLIIIIIIFFLWSWERLRRSSREIAVESVMEEIPTLPSSACHGLS